VFGSVFFRRVHPRTDPFYSSGYQAFPARPARFRKLCGAHLPRSRHRLAACVEDESDWLYVACASTICHACHAYHAYLAHYALHSLHAWCAPGEQQAQGACARGGHTAASDSGTFNLVSFLQWPFGRLCCPDMRWLLTPKGARRRCQCAGAAAVTDTEGAAPVSNLD